MMIMSPWICMIISHTNTMMSRRSVPCVVVIISLSLGQHNTQEEKLFHGSEAIWILLSLENFEVQKCSNTTWKVPRWSFLSWKVPSDIWKRLENSEMSWELSETIVNPRIFSGSFRKCSKAEESSGKAELSRQTFGSSRSSPRNLPISFLEDSSGFQSTKIACYFQKGFNFDFKLWIFKIEILIFKFKSSNLLAKLLVLLVQHIFSKTKLNSYPYRLRRI